ncbi:hypothetical protein ACTFIU_000489 [Dictyostelium citrinum]
MNKSIIFLLSFLSVALSQSQSKIFQVQYFQFEFGQCHGSDSGSASYDACQIYQENLVSTFYSSIGECLIFNNAYATLEWIESKNAVNYTIYETNACIGVISTEIIPLGQCLLNCAALEKNPYIINVIDSSSISIPTVNSFTIAYYDGECNGNWTNDFRSVQFMPTAGQCINQDYDTSVKLYCNTILNQITIAHFNTLNCEDDTPSSFDVIPMNGENCNYSGPLNMGLYCN